VEPLKIAVIGTKGMGRGHIKAIKDVAETELVAVCDVVKSEAEAAGKEFGVPHFTAVADLLASGRAEAVTICTPHWHHPPIAVQCAEAGVHVLTEKPMSVTVGGADEMIAACHEHDVVLSVVYQQRFAPIRVKARGIIESGALGKINRAELIYTCCRTNFYYSSGDWRATWAGEGGGVLLNQAPHLLDQFCWQVGMMPSRVTAKIETVMHPIEVEDRASALLEYQNGATGYVHVSTAETPPLARIEIAGDKGRLRMEGGKLTVHLLEESMAEFVENSDQMWATPPAKDLQEIDLSTGGDWLQGHAAHMKDLAEAVRTGSRPACTGEEGRWSVELADAIILSSQRGEPVDLPLDRDVYDGLMRSLSHGLDPRSKGVDGRARARREAQKQAVRDAAQKAIDAVESAAHTAGGAVMSAASRLREAAERLAGKAPAGTEKAAPKKAAPKKAAKKKAAKKKASPKRAAKKPAKKAKKKTAKKKPAKKKTSKKKPAKKKPAKKAKKAKKTAKKKPGKKG